MKNIIRFSVVLSSQSKDAGITAAIANLKRTKFFSLYTIFSYTFLRSQFYMKARGVEGKLVYENHSPV